MNNNEYKYGHIGFAASVDGLGDRVDQIAGNAEIANFHTAFAIDQNVARFHVAMNHFQLTV